MTTIGLKEYNKAYKLLESEGRYPVGIALRQIDDVLIPCIADDGRPIDGCTAITIDQQMDNITVMTLTLYVQRDASFDDVCAIDTTLSVGGGSHE